MELKNIKLTSEGKDQFMRRVFHEIKTPLHIFNNFTHDLFERIKTLNTTTNNANTSTNNNNNNNNTNNNSTTANGGIDEGMLEEMVGIQRNIDSILGTYSILIIYVYSICTCILYVCVYYSICIVLICTVYEVHMVHV